MEEALCRWIVDWQRGNSSVALPDLRAQRQLERVTCPEAKLHSSKSKMHVEKPIVTE